MAEVRTTESGFVYNPETMKWVETFIADVTVSTPDYHEFFYGTREEAEAFGIIFPAPQEENLNNN